MNKKLKSIFKVILLLLLGIILIYINIFPLARPMEIPMLDEIYSIEIEKGNTLARYTEDKEIAEIINLLSKAKPTRIITAHEIPMVREYYTIDFDVKDERLYRTFIYNEDSKWYVEQPYIGVYRIKNNIILPYIELLKKDLEN